MTFPIATAVPTSRGGHVGEILSESLELTRLCVLPMFADRQTLPARLAWSEGGPVSGVVGTSLKARCDGAVEPQVIAGVIRAFSSVSSGAGDRRTGEKGIRRRHQATKRAARGVSLASKRSLVP